VKLVFLFLCYGCIFHGTGNSGQLCQNFGISGGVWPSKPPPPFGTPPFSNLFFRKSCCIRDNVEKYGATRQAHAYCMPDTSDYRHTLRLCDNNCFCTTIMGTRKYLGVTLYVVYTYCQPCSCTLYTRIANLVLVRSIHVLPTFSLYVVYTYCQPCPCTLYTRIANLVLVCSIHVLPTLSLYVVYTYCQPCLWSVGLLSVYLQSHWRYRWNVTCFRMPW
jgi:hypothetical protein